jgi:methylamine---glutamate N-methyltransferase subunit B
LNAVALDCMTMTTREINAVLQRLDDGAHADLSNPRGRHNIAVGLWHDAVVDIRGDVGYYVGALGERADITVRGSCGWGAGENLMSGSVRITGNASQSTGASAHGGTVVVHGSAGARTAASLKGGTVVIGGSIGHAGAFMAQAGTLLVCGDTGPGLGDSLYEAVIYVGGQIAGLGADAVVVPLADSDRDAIDALLGASGIAGPDPATFTRVESARTLYHFDHVQSHAY